MTIRHIVMFSLRSDIDAADRSWLFSEIQAIARLPTVRSLALGQCLSPKEDWYRPRLSYEFDYALSMEFENEDALYAYQTHPSHVTLAQEIRKRTSAIKVMDFMNL